MIGRTVSLAATILLVLSAVAAGAPTWNAPVQLSVGDRALGPELALNAAGDGLVVWDHEVGAECPTEPAGLGCVHIVEATTRTRESATWQTPVEISRPGVDSRPTAGIGTSGDAAIVWVHDIGRDRVLQATFRRGLSGAWPEPSDLSEPTLEIRDQEIALDSAGNAVAVWAERAETAFAVKAATRSAASGVWGAPVRLSSGGATASAGPSLALAPSGEAIAAWVEGGSVVRVARGDATTGAWELQAVLSTSSAPVLGAPDVAVDPGGVGAVVWAQQATGESRRRVQVAYRPAGGSWQATRGLPLVLPGDAALPTVSLDRAANVLVAWLASGGVEAAVGSASGAMWTGTTVVARPGERATELRQAVDPSGNTVAVWKAEASGTVRASIRPGSSGAWQPAVQVSEPGASRPRVALADSGSGMAVWNQASGQRVVVDGARFDGTGPVIELLLAPRRVAVGVPAALGVRATPWAAPLVGPARWSFGDGGSATGNRVTHAYSKAGRYAISVTREDAAGGTSTSRRTILVGAPRNTARPSIQGKAHVGTSLTCLSGSWTGARPIRFAYQWLRSGESISGETRSRYRVRARDIGDVLGCRVRARNAVGATVAAARTVRVDR